MKPLLVFYVHQRIDRVVLCLERLKWCVMREGKLLVRIAMRLRSDLAKVVFSAVKPEVETSLRNVRSAIRILDSEVLEITISAPTLSLLRASMNSLMRLTSTVLEVIDVIREQQASANIYSST
ncbi:MAG: hypothetical protein DRO09_02790 [Thermoprotei archaeon]|nr:MAG: hypothetical protein DRO09_02790 [Thermoprotei archaeon]